jgi:predicted MFS family arabinose efflux permease
VTVRRRLFGTLCALVFLVNFGRVAFAPLVEPLQSAFGVGPATVGTVVSLAWLGTAVARFPAGYLLTRVPRRHVVLATGALLAVSAGFTGTATSVPALQVGAFAVGSTSGAYFVAAVPFIRDLVPERPGRAIGIHGTAAQVAAVVAPSVVFGVLAVASWRETFWLLAVAALGVTAVLYAVDGDDDADGTGGVDADFLGALGEWRVIATGIALIAAAGFVWQGLFNFYVSFLVAEKGLTRAAAGTALTVVFAAGLPAFYLGGRLADRLPHLPYILATLGVYVASVLAVTYVEGFVPILAVTVVLGYTLYSLFPALDTYVLEVLPSEHRGSAYALFSGVSLLIEANGSGAVGFLTEAGYTFTAVFRGFGVGLGAVLAVLVVAYFVGAMPGSARGAHGVRDFVTR